MKSIMRKCNVCSIYTLKDACPRCSRTTVMPVPPRYSPEDAYGVYRRRLKKLINTETGTAESSCGSRK